ncbi:MAG: hypothetical protein HY359_07795 [Candidatus Rokubacteria bacterium]|nr:hypothetical protein [Candidatus Rokubacteria bacterium]
MLRSVASATVAVLSALVLVAPAGASDAREANTALEIRAIFDRLQPGMTIEQVAESASRPHLGARGHPVSSWLVWSPPGAGGPTAVLRAVFRDDRLARLEYESFGEEYQHRVKGAEPVELDEAELRRLWQRGRAVDECHGALEAFHRLLLRIQDRLTPAEQEAWVRALELRRAAESRATR